MCIQMDPSYLWGGVYVEPWLESLAFVVRCAPLLPALGWGDGMVHLQFGVVAEEVPLFGGTVQSRVRLGEHETVPILKMVPTSFQSYLEQRWRVAICLIFYVASGEYKWMNVSFYFLNYNLFSIMNVSQKFVRKTDVFFRPLESSALTISWLWDTSSVFFSSFLGYSFVNISNFETSSILQPWRSGRPVPPPRLLIWPQAVDKTPISVNDPSSPELTLSRAAVRVADGKASDIFIRETWLLVKECAAVVCHATCFWGEKCWGTPRIVSP